MIEGQRPAPVRLDLPARLASAAVLGAVAVAALVVGGLAFSALVAAVAIAALLEWHRLVNGGHIALETLPAALALLAVGWFGRLSEGAGTAVLAIVAGAVGSALIAGIRGPRPFWPIPWHAAGAAYLGLPALALMALRRQENGAAVVGGLFIAIWAADTGALFAGRAIGGPKLAPVLSPNKTWAGFAGGTVAAGLAEAVYVGVLHGAVLRGFLFGLALALTGHLGDLFESWVKRQFHAKNSGTLIPGHGGMLDRIDSLLFGAPVCAMLVMVAGVSPFGGAV